jgi:hypothetical protein
MSIIGIVLSIIAIGLIFHFRKEYKESIHFLEGEAEATEHGYNALMKDFINYQVDTDRKIAELEKQLETKIPQLDRKIDKLRKELPSTIGKVVGQIEFAQDKMNRQM